MQQIPAWARRRFPELDSFETDAQRTEAWFAATSALKFNWRYWVMLLVLLSAFAVGTVMCVQSVLPRLDIGNPFLKTALPALIVSFFSIVLSLAAVLIFRRSVALSIRRRLLDAGIPVCLACGYDLRGQHQPRCPECGRPFDASILPHHPQ